MAQSSTCFGMICTVDSLLGASQNSAVGSFCCDAAPAGLDGSASPVKRKRKKTDAYVHIGTTEDYNVSMSDKDRRQLECEKVRSSQQL